MPRSLTAPQTTASARTIVSPLWFLQIGFTTPVRLTSGPTRTWNGFSWTESKMDVRGVKWDGSIGQAVTFELADPTLALTTLCVAQKLTNRAVQLWLTDASATAVNDPVAMPPLVGDNWIIPHNYAVQISATVTTNKSIPATQWVALLPPQLSMSARTILWNGGELSVTPRPVTA